VGGGLGFFWGWGFLGGGVGGLGGGGVGFFLGWGGGGGGGGLGFWGVSPSTFNPVHLHTTSNKVHSRRASCSPPPAGCETPVSPDLYRPLRSFTCPTLHDSFYPPLTGRFFCVFSVVLRLHIGLFFDTFFPDSFARTRRSDFSDFC